MPLVVTSLGSLLALVVSVEMVMGPEVLRLELVLSVGADHLFFYLVHQLFVQTVDCFRFKVAVMVLQIKNFRGL